MVVGDVACGDKALAAVDNVIIAIPDTGGVDSGGVAARIRLRQAERTDGTVVEHFGNKLQLLLLCAEFLDECGKTVSQ